MREKSIYFFIGTTAELIKLAPVIKELKKRKDAAELYLQGNREELAEKEKKEASIIEKYLN